MYRYIDIYVCVYLPPSMLLSPPSSLLVVKLPLSAIPAIASHLKLLLKKKCEGDLNRLL
jgi:hypothetical protein